MGVDGRRGLSKWIQPAGQSPKETLRDRILMAYDDKPRMSSLKAECYRAVMDAPSVALGFTLIDPKALKNWSDNGRRVTVIEYEDGQFKL